MTLRYDLVPTPLGDALVMFSDEGIVQCHIADALDQGIPWVLEGATLKIPVIPDYDPEAAADLRPLMERYFRGEPVNFLDHVTLDWQLTGDFHRRVLETIATIPWGETLSYGEVAILAGHPGAARAVGTTCRQTPFSLIIPVHRVIQASGKPGRYGAHPEHKQFLLDLESGAFPASDIAGDDSGDPDE